MAMDNTASSPLLNAKSAAERYHGKIPYVRTLPASVVGIILAVAVVNAMVWAAVGVVLVCSLLIYVETKNDFDTDMACSISTGKLTPVSGRVVIKRRLTAEWLRRPLLATAVLAYTLGLRHALDADHIAAIDLMTRRLIASGRNPVAVGMYFSLGHSTIVILTSIAVAATSASLSERFDSFSRVGSIIGTGVSAGFLIVLAGLNAFVLWKLVVKLRGVLRGEGSGEENALAEALQGAGCLTRMFKGAFRMVDREWKMYPLGVLCICPPSIDFRSVWRTNLIGI